MPEKDVVRRQGALREIREGDRPPGERIIPALPDQVPLEIEKEHRVDLRLIR